MKTTISTGSEKRSPAIKSSILASFIFSFESVLARWTSGCVRMNCQATFWTNTFRPKSFDETRYNDDSQKDHDEECDFPKTDRHLFNLRRFSSFNTEIG